MAAQGTLKAAAAACAFATVAGRAAADSVRPASELNTRCLLYHGDGCNTIEDEHKCTNSRDGRFLDYLEGRKIRSEPCIWCSEGGCSGEGTPKCEPYQFMIGNPHRPPPAVWVAANCIDGRDRQESIDRSPGYSTQMGDGRAPAPGDWAPVGGGEGQVCRGKSTLDRGSREADQWSYAIWTAVSFEQCKSFCVENCQGIEYKASEDYCEVWYDPIHYSEPLPGYQCYKKEAPLPPMKWSTTPTMAPATTPEALPTPEPLANPAPGSLTIPAVQQAKDLPGVAEAAEGAADAADAAGATAAAAAAGAAGAAGAAVAAGAAGAAGAADAAGAAAADAADAAAAAAGEVKPVTLPAEVTPAEVGDAAAAGASGGADGAEVAEATTAEEAGEPAAPEDPAAAADEAKDDAAAAQEAAEESDGPAVVTDKSVAEADWPAPIQQVPGAPGGRFVQTVDKDGNRGEVFWQDAAGKHDLPPGVNCEECGCDGENVAVVSEDELAALPKGDFFHCVAVAPAAPTVIPAGGRFVVVEEEAAPVTSEDVATSGEASAAAEATVSVGATERKVYWQSSTGKTHLVPSDYDCNSCSNCAYAIRVAASEVKAAAQGGDFTCDMVAPAALPIVPAIQAAPAIAAVQKEVPEISTVPQAPAIPTVQQAAPEILKVPQAPAIPTVQQAAPEILTVPQAPATPTAQQAAPKILTVPQTPDAQKQSKKALSMEEGSDKKGAADKIDPINSQWALLAIAALLVAGVVGFGVYVVSGRKGVGKKSRGKVKMHDDQEEDSDSDVEAASPLSGDYSNDGNNAIQANSKDAPLMQPLVPSSGGARQVVSPEMLRLGAGSGDQAMTLFNQIDRNHSTGISHDEWDKYAFDAFSQNQARTPQR